LLPHSLSMHNYTLSTSSITTFLVKQIKQSVRTFYHDSVPTFV
jgi:hypothetical protein